VLRTRVRAGVAAGIILSVVFAALFSVVYAADLYVASWAPRWGAPTAVAIRVPFTPYVIEGDGADVAARYEHRRILVPRGVVLDPTNEEHRIAMTFEATRRPVPPLRLVGVALIYLTLSMLFATYARRFGPSTAKLLRTQLGLFVLMLATLVVGKALLLFTSLPEYWIPVAQVPLWITLYLDRRSAFLINVVLTFFVASLTRFDILFLVVLLVRGMAGSLAFWNKKRPRQMVLAGFIAGVAAVVLFTAATLVFDGRFDLAADLAHPGDSSVLACLGGGVIAGLVGLFLREPTERLLGAVGRDRLLDLTDLEQPLLLKMSREAPGSWEHCRAMANLAEAAAAAIGADALLVRCGAYYHDLGKTIQPKYFVENLAPGERSPHEELEPHVSADAIMAHVVQGTKILRDGGVPEPVVEFAYTHHGTQVVEYFWHKCREHGNPQNLTEDAFRYPGMKPRTRETAILMLVDSIEAASRTISPPEHAKFEEMIQRVIFTKLKSGQLDEAGLSSGDLRLLVTRMSDTLVNMFHGRIKYPWQKAQEAAAAAAAGPSAAKESGTSGTRTATPAQGATVVRLPRPGDKP
jgi:putative nucleotidyltransferase with HDIG domain